MKSISTMITKKRNIHRSKIMLCIWWDQKKVSYYELLKPNETVTGVCYLLQLIDLNLALNENLPIPANKQNKVILLYDNARLHLAKPVKISWNNLNGKFYRSLPIQQTVHHRIITYFVK